MKTVLSSPLRKTSRSQRSHTSPCQRRRRELKSSSNSCSSSKTRSHHHSNMSLKKQQAISAARGVAPMSTKGAMNKPFKPLFKACAMISPTTPIIPATTVTLYGKRAARSLAHNVALPCILMDSSGSSSRQLSKSHAEAPVVRAPHP